MNKIDLVKQNLNFDTPDVSAANMTDDFQFTDSVGGAPFDKTAFLGMGQMMKAAMPDIHYVVDDIREDGDDVLLTSYIVGTFTNDFDLSAMGMGVIPASGKAVNFPTSTSRISFTGDKMSKIHDTATGPDAGLPGFVKALGAKMG